MPAPHTEKGEDSRTVPIHIVDLSVFTDPSAQLPDGVSGEGAKRDVGKALVEACRDAGFVYVTGHGVPQTEVDQAFATSRKFYDLPTEDKMKAPHPPGWAVHRGYSWPGLEKVSNAMSDRDDEEAAEKLREVQDYKESYEVGSEQNPDMPNVWLPDGVLPEWKPNMTSFYWTCWKASKAILSALAEGLEIEEEHLLRPHSGHYNQLRLLHYPPVPARAIEGGKFARMPPHTDWSTITILFQDDCGGLQIEDPKQPDEFIDVLPIQGSLILNIGDFLMRWSNDYLKSTQHRVQLPPRQDHFSGDERMTRSRFSIPYFIGPDPDQIVGCLRSDEQNPPKYEPISHRDYTAMRARMQYQ